ncbi:ApbE family protein [Klebsiella pneumoniae]|uniref:ApbE family protein n=1 Tax=Klebsiella pneumoniae TaxID=573 RepID=A0A377X965_KLEPN|nr:ApbE family protein [Klebsiella pneumoniae]
MSDNRVYSYSAVLMGSPILLKLCSHDEAMASRVFQLIKRYEDLLTVNRAESQVMDINHAAGRHPVTVSRPGLSADPVRQSRQHGARQRL